MISSYNEASTFCEYTLSITYLIVVSALYAETMIDSTGYTIIT